MSSSLASARKLTQTPQKIPFRSICVLLSQMTNISHGATNATCLMFLNESELSYPSPLSWRAGGVEKLAVECFPNGFN